MNSTTETRQKTTNFAVRARNVKKNKVETHYFDTKPQAETFRSGCRPTEFISPVVYPIALYDKICG